MESEDKTVLSDRCEGSGNSSEVDSDENVQNKNKSEVRFVSFL